MKGQHYFYYVTFKKNFTPEEDMKKYFYQDMHCMYATTYEYDGDKSVKIGVYNNNAFTKEEWTDEFIVLKKFISDVESI